ncbi:MAG: YihY/virulence factor BrkB family protein [Candidatus Aminicenantes bacterium]|nr:MAG: YihY/virulence factor BrkB family protein [Candidatus Aminicenantes bacterium]
MNFPVFGIVKTAVQRFHADRCGNFAIIISYFALMCSIPLAALFAYATTKILGNSELAVRSLDIFSEEFFAQLDPYFFERVQELSQNITNLGWFGLAGSFIAASFLFSNLIHSINFIFRADYHKSFFYNRLMEYLIMFVIGVIMLISLSITAIWTALNRTLQESPFVANNINPEIVSLINNFFVQYLLPFTLTFLVFFSLYKFIPEIKVYTKPAAIAAAIAALLIEIFKRIFAFYVAHFSAIGIVLDRLMQGTLTSIIFFLLWLTFSMVILLWGAELGAVLNERIPKKQESNA